LLALKGVHFALRAFSSFIEGGSDGELTFIGSGPMRERLRLSVEQFGLGGRVHFIDSVAQSELFRMYPKFDVLLFPSLHDSGGNVVLEALSFGLPVICLDLGGPCGFVDRSCGIVVGARTLSEEQLVVALAKALHSLSNNQEQYESLCKGARSRAESLTWARQIDRVLALATSCLPSAHTALSSARLESETEE
jgi:glycosyltransferase involved in cell wall biosynthesis